MKPAMRISSKAIMQRLQAGITQQTSMASFYTGVSCSLFWLLMPDGSKSSGFEIKNDDEEDELLARARRDLEGISDEEGSPVWMKSRETSDICLYVFEMYAVY